MVNFILCICIFVYYIYNILCIFYLQYKSNGALLSKLPELITDYHWTWFLPMLKPHFNKVPLNVFCFTKFCLCETNEYITSWISFSSSSTLSRRCLLSVSIERSSSRTELLSPSAWWALTSQSSARSWSIWNLSNKSWFSLSWFNHNQIVSKLVIITHWNTHVINIYTHWDFCFNLGSISYLCRHYTK